MVKYTTDKIQIETHQFLYYRNSLGAATPKSLLRTTTCDTTPISKNVSASYVVFAWNYNPPIFLVSSAKSFA
jgi:hypothetical protein